MYCEVRGQLSRLSSLLLLCGYQGLNSTYQPWQWGPLPTEPSSSPCILFCETGSHAIVQSSLELVADLPQPHEYKFTSRESWIWRDGRALRLTTSFTEHLSSVPRTPGSLQLPVTPAPGYPVSSFRPQEHLYSCMYIPTTSPPHTHKSYKNIICMWVCAGDQLQAGCCTWAMLPARVLICIMV